MNSNIKSHCFQIVHKALIEVYGENYPDKCLQASIGINRLLKKHRIQSTIINGACCVVMTEDSKPHSWGGFWDKDHHVWLISESNEIIDLSICQLHLHVAVESKNLDPIPAIWWEQANLTPSIFKYLPASKVSEQVQTESSKDQLLLDDFLVRIDELSSEFEIGSLKFDSPILDNPDTLNELYNQGNQWAVGASLANGLTMPTWILNREIELVRNHKSL